MARWQTCNVLSVGSQKKQLWVFGATSEKFPLQKEETKLPAEALSPQLIKKEWETLLRPKLNVAWLPPEKVFLRAIEVPKADAAEVRAMIELQLEKVSPLPVAQIVWSYELVSHPLGDMQTAIVIIVASDVVEEFLGQLEAQGYLADRLELPLLDRLRTTRVEGDGVWIYPAANDDGALCLIAWWYGGVLWNLSLVNLPTGADRAAVLTEQLHQMAWSGELEGWINSPPRYHLVADEAASDEWVRQFARETEARFLAPVALRDLATLTGRRSVAGNPTTNLLPSGYGTRYRQLFFDRLWMQGIFAVLAVYLLGILIYFGWAQVQSMRLDGFKDDAAKLAVTYTNTLQLKEQVRVLRDQLDLQYAALDCWRTVAASLPPELTLDSMRFDNEQKVNFSGFGNAEDRTKVYEFNEALLKAPGRVTNQTLFAKVESPKINARPGTQVINWSINCDLRRSGGGE
jgi:hypothetical protein